MRTLPPDPAAGRISTVARVMGTSTSTVRRTWHRDPDFPKPFRLSVEGELMWLLADIRTYLDRKAGRPIAA